MSWAKFNSDSDAATRSTAENLARGETYFGLIYLHQSDGTAILNIDDTFVDDALAPVAIGGYADDVSAAVAGYLVPGMENASDKLDAQKLAKAEELLDCAHAYVHTYFSGPAYSVINSLNDLSYAIAIHENDGTKLSYTALADLFWVSALWQDYFIRKATVEAAQDTTSIDAVSCDYSNNGQPPFFIEVVQSEYNTLLGTITAGLPNVPQNIKDLFGL